MTPTDDEIVAMLAVRAGRASVGDTKTAALLAAARERAAADPRLPHRRFRVTGTMPRLAAGAASVAAAVLVIALVALPLANRPPASAVPSVGPSTVIEPRGSPLSPSPDTGYYPGGIPQSIDGEPVLVGLDTQRRLADATDDSSFLAGGFTWYGPAMCGGGIGPRDPNPLASDACPRYRIAGVPGRLFVPTGRLEVGDVPLVVRVHTRDPGAETCWPQNVEMCRASVVLEAVLWQGDAATRAVPLGPREAIGRALNIWIGDSRKLADGSISYVDEPRFAMPISCPAPWPALVYALRGDPRLGLLAVFGDQAARTAFQASVESSAGASCLNSSIDRLDSPRWIGQDNLLVLAYADDPTADEIAAQLAWVEGAQRNAIPLPAASIDRSRETLLDYLDSRAAGPGVTGVNDEIPTLNFGPAPTHADGNPAINVSAGWSKDVLRRYEANALDGVVELVTDAPTTAQLGDAASIVESTGAARVWLYRVTYPDATDQRFATEEFAIVQIPGSTFRDWGIIRVTGEPFPIVPIPVPEPDTEHPFPSGVILPIQPGGDTPCLPAGQECP